MTYDLIIFGVPYGHQTSVCDDKTAEFLENNYINTRHGMHRKMFTRNKNETHYILLDYGEQGTKFIDVNGRAGSYFGMDLIMKNNYAADPMKVFKVLEETYKQYVTGKIIQEFPNGNKKWMFNDLRANNDQICTYVANGLKNLIETRPELNINNIIKPMTPPQQPQITQSQTER